MSSGNTRIYAATSTPACCIKITSTRYHAAHRPQHGIVFDKGQLTVFRAIPEKFSPLLQMQVMGGKCWTSPVFANGRIYCRNAKGKLACVRFDEGSD